MKQKALQEYRAKQSRELIEELAKYEQRLESLRFELAAGKVKNIREVREVKASLAQFKTLLAEQARRDLRAAS
jgi:ribosomal protein L29